MNEGRTRPPLGDSRYRISQLEGSGNFAEVWSGVDERFDIDVAVKVLASHWAADPDVRERFIDEARLLREIVDSAVVRVHDIGETTDGRPYFVMDLAAGGTLEGRLEHLAATGAAVPPGEVRRIVAFLEQAMNALHDRGLVHRDIKPGNILISGDGRSADSVVLDPQETLLLGDFGMARDAESTALTRAGGTPGYRSPEQREAHGSPDHRADIFAASATIVSLYEPKRRGVERTFSNGSLIAGVDLPEAVPSGARGALTQGLDVDPDRRPSSAQQWAESVSSGIDADPALVVRGRAPLLVAAAVLLVVAGLLAVFLSTRGDGDDEILVGTSEAPGTETEVAGTEVAETFDVIGNDVLGLFEQNWFWLEEPSIDGAGFVFNGGFLEDRSFWIEPTSSGLGSFEARAAENSPGEEFRYSVISRLSIDYACALITEEEIEELFALDTVRQTSPPTVYRNQCKWVDGDDVVIDLFWHRADSAVARGRWLESEGAVESTSEGRRVLEVDDRLLLDGEDVSIEVIATVADPTAMRALADLSLGRTDDDADRPGDLGAAEPDAVTLGCSLLTAEEVSDAFGSEFVRLPQTAQNACTYGPQVGQEGGLTVGVVANNDAPFAETVSQFADQLQATAEPIDAGEEAFILDTGAIVTVIVRVGDRTATLGGLFVETPAMIALAEIAAGRL